MCEHCDDGHKISASPERLAAYSKLSKRAYWYTIKSLRKRGILSQLAPGSAAEQRSAIYRINQAAFQDDPRMAQYLDDQENLPGIDRPWEPIVPTKSSQPCAIIAQGRKGKDVAHLVQPVHEPCANPAVDPVQDLRAPCAVIARDSNPLHSNPVYSKPLDSQPGAKSSRGVCNILPSDDDRTPVQPQPLIGQVREIAALYPKVHDAFHLTAEVHSAIAAAIARDGRDLVWAGTKGMADVVARWPRDELRFIPSAARYFRESQYRKDPAEWERKGGKADEQQRIFDREREILRKRQQSRGANA